MSEGIQEKQFRADPGSDPVENAPEFKGVQSSEEIDEAMTDRFDEVMARLEVDPNDQEAIREGNVLVERYDELVRRLKSKITQG